MHYIDHWALRTKHWRFFISKTRVLVHAKMLLGRKRTEFQLKNSIDPEYDAGYSI